MQIEGKIWGVTQEILFTEAFSWHRATINAGFRCSRHLHEEKHNGFFLEKGRLLIRVYRDNGVEDVTTLEPGQFTAVEPLVEHRFEALSDSVCFEFYWPRPGVIVRRDDIVRRDQGGPL